MFISGCYIACRLHLNLLEGVLHFNPLSMLPVVFVGPWLTGELGLKRHFKNICFFCCFFFMKNKNKNDWSQSRSVLT